MKGFVFTIQSKMNAYMCELCMKERVIQTPPKECKVCNTTVKTRYYNDSTSMYKVIQPSTRFVRMGGSCLM